jgi:hypothetical protein
MQHHAGNFDVLYRADLLSAIGLISQNWMAQGCQMDAELVRPACTWAEQHMGSQFSEAMIDFIFRHRFLGSRRVGRELFPFFLVFVKCLEYLLSLSPR